MTAPPETTDPRHDEKFRMMVERLIGYCTMHGRDMAKDPDAWGDTIREAHRKVIDYAESRMAASPAREPAPTPDLVAIEALLDAYAAEEYRAGNPEPIKTAAADMPRRRARAALLRAFAESEERAKKAEAERNEARKQSFSGHDWNRLLNERDAGRARASSAEAAGSALREALVFAASVIRCGEPWTETCERIIGGALASPDHAGKEG